MQDISAIVRTARTLHIHTRKSVLGRHAGPYCSSWSGAGFSFRQLRSYTPGDDIRFVDWKSTARTGELLVRDYYDEHNRVFIVMLDCSASMQFSSTDMSKAELASRIAATLAYSCYLHGDAVGYVGFSDGLCTHIPPKTGGSHVRTIIEHMLHDAQNVCGDMDMSCMMHEVLKRYSRPVGIICVSDFLHDAYDSAIKKAAYRHALMPIRVLDKQEVDMHIPNEVQLYDPETREPLVMSRSARDIYHAWIREHDRHFHRVMRRNALTSCTCYTHRDWVSQVRKYMYGVENNDITTGSSV